MEWWSSNTSQFLPIFWLNKCLKRVFLTIFWLKCGLWTLTKIILSLGKNLFESQKNDITDCCSNAILLKLNKFLPTGILPHLFVTEDSFLTTYKKEMGESLMKWVSDNQHCHYHFTYSQVITNQHNFKASFGDLVGIFHNCADHVY